MYNYSGERVLLNPGYEFPMRKGDRVYVLGIRGYKRVADVSCPARQKSMMSRIMRKQSSVLVKKKDRQKDSVSTLKSNYEAKCRMGEYLDQVNASLL